MQRICSTKHRHFTLLEKAIQLPPFSSPPARAGFDRRGLERGDVHGDPLQGREGERGARLRALLRPPHALRGLHAAQRLPREHIYLSPIKNDSSNFERFITKLCTILRG